MSERLGANITQGVPPPVSESNWLGRALVPALYFLYVSTSLLTCFEIWQLLAQWVAWRWDVSVKWVWWAFWVAVWAVVGAAWSVWEWWPVLAPVMRKVGW